MYGWFGGELLAASTAGRGRLVPNKSAKVCPAKLERRSRGEGGVPVGPSAIVIDVGGVVRWKR